MGNPILRIIMQWYKIINFIFTIIVIAYLLATTRRSGYTRFFFWPLFVFCSLMATIPIYFLVHLLTFFLPSQFFILKLGEVYFSNFGNKYAYSFDCLFLVLTIPASWIVWRITNEYELVLYKSTVFVSKIERLFGVVLGILILFYLFNLTSSPIHKHFFLDTFEYYSKNPFIYDK
jgi:hypothetical protein